MHIVIIEDIGEKNFLPLTSNRPVFDLLSGTRPNFQRISGIFPKSRLSVVIRDELHDLFEEKYPNLNLYTRDESNDVLAVNGRALIEDEFLKAVKSLKRKKETALIVNGDDWLGFYASSGRDFPEVEIMKGGFSGNKHSYKTIELDTPVIKYPWDIIKLNERIISDDFKRFVKKGKGRTKKRNPIPSNVTLKNRRNIYLGNKISIQPFVIIDASRGPVIVEDEAVIMGFSFIEGPAYIGSKSVIKIGTQIYRGTSIGCNCRIGGEISSSLFYAHSNKAHGGFIGHSYIGEWNNIGAGTNNSNLKNDYGEIEVTVNDVKVKTGERFFGMVMGDHSRMAINSTINTGTVIGIGCNVFGSGFPPKVLPDFSWGGSDVLRKYDFNRFIESAKVMCQRRGITISEAEIRLLRAIYERRKDNG